MRGEEKPIDTFCRKGNSRNFSKRKAFIFLFCVGLGYGSGYCVNFADIVPAYSGVIFGLANTFASLAGLTGNLVAGLLVKKPILEQWRKLYIMFGIVYFVGGLVFLLFGTAVPRKWAKFQSANANTTEKKINDEETVPMNEKVCEVRL